MVALVKIQGALISMLRSRRPITRMVVGQHSAIVATEERQAATVVGTRRVDRTGTGMVDKRRTSRDSSMDTGSTGRNRSNRTELVVAGSQLTAHRGMDVPRQCSAMGSEGCRSSKVA